MACLLAPFHNCYPYHPSHHSHPNNSNHQEFKRKNFPPKCVVAYNLAYGFKDGPMVIRPTTLVLPSSQIVCLTGNSAASPEPCPTPQTHPHPLPNIHLRFYFIQSLGPVVRLTCLLSCPFRSPPPFMPLMPIQCPSTSVRLSYSPSLLLTHSLFHIPFCDITIELLVYESCAFLDCRGYPVTMATVLPQSPCYPATPTSLSPRSDGQPATVIACSSQPVWLLQPSS